MSGGGPRRLRGRRWGWRRRGAGLAHFVCAAFLALWRDGRKRRRRRRRGRILLLFRFRFRAQSIDGLLGLGIDDAGPARAILRDDDGVLFLLLCRLLSCRGRSRRTRRGRSVLSRLSIGTFIRDRHHRGRCAIAIDGASAGTRVLARKDGIRRRLLTRATKLVVAVRAG